MHTQAKKAANREPEVSFADFTALSSRAEAVAAEAAAASAAVAEVRDKALPAVNEALSDLKDQVRVRDLLCDQCDRDPGVRLVERAGLWAASEWEAIGDLTDQTEGWVGWSSGAWGWVDMTPSLCPSRSSHVPAAHAASHAANLENKATCPAV